jgi:RimJ/RimL family protein N-acetyltransferase
MERNWARLTAPALASQRLDLEPLTVGHAAEAALVFDDARLHTYMGSVPATVDELRSRFRRQSPGRSPDGSQDWLNWMIRDRASDALAGTVQATVHHAGEHHDGRRLLAEVAWVVTTPFQGQGVATEAATVMIDWLSRSGVDGIIAHVHPDNQASIGVARNLGLHPSDVTQDDEVRWIS